MNISFLLIFVNFYTIVLIDGQSTYFTLNTFISDTLNQITAKNLLTLDQQCNQILKIWQKALEDKTFWAKDVVDSFGRRPSGFVYGNIVWPGQYSQCLDIHVDQWTSKYCYVNEKIQWTNILIKNDTLRFKYGMCFPTLCKDDDLTKIFQYALRNLDKNVLPFNSSYLLNSRVSCRGKVNIDAYTIIAIILTGLISLLVLSGTAIDIFQLTLKQNDKQTLKKNETDSSTVQNEIQLQESIKATTKINQLVKILLTFSAYTNTLKIFKIDEKTKSQFSCLHPMRFLAFLWVVVLHQWNHFIGIDDILVDNRFEYLDWKKNFFFTFISNGFFCVDMFFLISGFLCSYTFLRNVMGKKITVFTIIKFYLRRYYRISVTLILVMLFMVGFNRFFHSGPFHGIFYEVNEKNCPAFFWTNLLYINNFYNRFCFPHSWYLAADMQFYFISPLVLIPLSYKNKVRLLGYFFIAALILIHMATTAFFSWDFLANEQDYDRVTLMYNFLELRSWYRVAPFAFGLLLGKIIIDLPRQKYIFMNNRTHNKIVITILWILSILFFNIVIFAQFGTFSGLNVMSRVNQVFYVTICRIVFSLGFGCMIFLCVTQNGYFINKFLSMSFWIPLAKLSFCSYLIHYSIVDTFIYVQEHFIHMQPSYFMYVFCGNVFFSICLALIVNLLFESPFTNLEKFIFKN